MNPSRQGLTLVEVTVALTVAALVVAVAYLALVTVSDAQDRAARARAAATHAAATRAQLQSWLRAVSRAPGAGPFRGTVDDYDNSEMRLVVDNAGPLWPGRHRVRLWVDLDPLSPQNGLLAEVRSFRLRRLGPPDTVVLAPDVNRMSASYLVPAQPGWHWLPAWESDSVVPRAIEVRLGHLGRVRLGAPDVEGGTLHALLTLPIVVPTAPYW